MILSREQVRSIDRRALADFGVPGIVLMENAGRGAADHLLRQGVRGPVVVCCGKGNNGGDGFVIARHLDIHRVPIRVVLLAHPEELTGDAATNHHIVERSGVPIAVWAGAGLDAAPLHSALSGAEWIVDALFGTGLTGAIGSPLDQAVEAINACGARVFAVDIPSGLDCDTGQPLGPTVRAEQTATFVALKKGFTNPAARAWLGTVHVVDIGAPRRLLDEFA